MKKSLVFASLAVVLCLVTAIVYVHACSGVPGIPNAELNSRFEKADTNRDGILSREEFEAYLVVMKSSKPISLVQVCPETGDECDMITGNGKEETGICSAQKNAETVAVKSVTETPVKKEGGCCGGKMAKKDGAETVAVKSVTETPVKKEGGCCGGKMAKKDGAETVVVKSVTETPVKKEGGCCGGKMAKKDGAETVVLKSVTETPVKKEGGCCGGKMAKKDAAETVAVKSVTETPVKKEGGCCGGKKASETAAVTETEPKKDCCAEEPKS
ncbi:MAG: hypothetical protein LBQ50_02540 [Planctomycetaceae bacterium]|jgi:hypothetical protein|nr:hypothetical protein [Planctomycetaceae bacterium]